MPFFGKMSTIAQFLLYGFHLADRTKEDYIQDCEMFDELFLLLLLLL